MFALACTEADTLALSATFNQELPHLMGYV